MRLRLAEDPRVLRSAHAGSYRWSPEGWTRGNEVWDSPSGGHPCRVAPPSLTRARGDCGGYLSSPDHLRGKAHNVLRVPSVDRETSGARLRTQALDAQGSALSR